MSALPPPGVPFVARNYTNGAPTATTAPVGASGTTLAVGPLTGWPSPPYRVVVDRGAASYEAMTVTAAVASGGGTVLIVVRSSDGNGATAHGTGAPVELTGLASDYIEAQAHRLDPDRDDHTGIMRSDGTRHDLTARHVLGTSIAVAAPGQVRVGDAASEGTSSALAAADHSHGDATGLLSDLNAWLPVGLVVPISDSACTYPQSLPTGLAWADGGWYPRTALPGLSGLLGASYRPFSALQPLSVLPTAVAALPQYQGAYDQATQVALPCLLYWTQGATAPQWYWSPPGAVLPVGWAIVTG